MDLGRDNILDKQLVKELEESYLNYSMSVIMSRALPDASCLLYTSPSPRDVEESRMPSSA